MVKAIEFLPKVRYWECPAFQLLLSCSVGTLLFSLNLVRTGAIILATLGIIIFILSRITKRKSLRQNLQHISLLILLSIIFLGYSYFRTTPVRQIKQGITLYDTEIIILNPISASLESEIRFAGKVRDSSGYWYKVQIKIPDERMLPEAHYFGSKIRATIDLSSMDKMKGKGYSHFLLSEGYEAQGTIQSISSIAPLTHPPLQSKLQGIRHQLIKKFEESSSNLHVIDQEERGMIYALALGERSHLPREVKDAFKSSGVAHILAVSGYHLGIVYLFLSFILGRLMPNYKQQKWKSILLLSGLLTYTLLSGASTATVRAFIMASLAILAKFLDRQTEPIQLLSLTLLFFLIINPYAYLSIGLMLSISAVWGIFVFMPIFQEYFSTSIQALQYILNIILVSLAAQIGVFPLLLFYFGTASLTFIWSNIPLIVISGILIPFALMVLFLLPILGSLPTIIFQILGWMSRGMIEVADFFAHLSSGLHTTFDIPLLVLYYLFLILLYPLLYKRANQHYINRLR